MGLIDYVSAKFLESPYYTLEETVLYGVLLVAAAWLVYRKLLKGKVEIDRNFTLALLPYIVLGSLLRSVGDVVRVVSPESYLISFLITPGIYLTTFVITLLVFLGSRRLERPYWKTMAWTGGLLSLAVFLYLVPVISNWTGVLLGVGIALAWAPLLYGLHYYLPDYLTRENAAILWSHMLDASATFTALTFSTGLQEIHLLPRTLISGLGLGPAVMFLLKLAVVWPVLYYIDMDTEGEYNTWLKMIVLILGLALGIHNLMAIGILGSPV